jgi:hypothetical protein
MRREVPRALGCLLLACLLASPGCDGGAGSPDAGLDGLQDGLQDGDDGGPDAEGDAGPDGDQAGDPDPVALRVTAVLPSRGPIQGGTWVSVLGEGFVRGIGESPFDARDVTSVTFGDNPAIDIEVVRDDMLSVRTPPGLAGPTVVSVENPNGRFSLPGAFDFFDSVTLERVEPSALAAWGGTPLSLQGTGFTPDTRVVLGGRLAAETTVLSAEEIQAVAPPGEPGPADLEVWNRNGRVLRYQAVVFHPRARLDAVEPPSGEPAGADSLALVGQGLSPACEVFLGDAPALVTAAPSAARLEVQSPPGLPGPVDVRVACPLSEARLPGGFVYLPQPSGSLSLTGLAPGAGPESGGQRVALLGEGFLEPLLEVQFDGVPAALEALDSDRLAWLVTPPGAPGPVDVTALTAGPAADLIAGFRFFTPLALSAVAPGTSPSQGGVALEVAGAGFHAGMSVWVGGRPAGGLEILAPDRLVCLAPPGSPGPVAVEVEDEDSRAGLPDALVYQGELGLVRAEPDVGSQAGGTFVTLLGGGFGPGTRVWFGEREASLVQIGSPSALSVRSPRGEPGEVSVRIEREGQQVELPAGFAYVDPTNDRGGASGGPLRGALDVTVLDSGWGQYGQRLAGASVLVAEPALSGLTDERGQVTFSGPGLVRAVDLTVAKEGYQAITLVRLNAARVTVYLSPNEQPPIDPQPGGDPPKTTSLSGRVFGFKEVPWLPVPPGVSLEARVAFTSYSLYSVPPYAGIPQGQPVFSDGGTYEWTVRLGEYNLVALYGSNDPATRKFTPALMGVRRGIQAFSETPVRDQDIVLGTPLDSSVRVRLVDPPLSSGELPARYAAYVSLDLGRDGVVYLDQAEGIEAELVLSHLPAAAADAFLFVGLAHTGGGYPFSYVFGRRSGELSGGLDLGPFLGFPYLTSPANDGELTGGRIAWRVEGAPPALTQLLIQTSDLLPKLLWRVVLPGEVTEVRLPAELLSLLPRGERLQLLIYTANSPRFDFDRFNYSQLSSGRWTAYTVNYTTFTAP